MLFNLAQTFYVDGDAVAKSDNIVLSSINLYFKGVPKATNNKSGINSPGVTVTIAKVLPDGSPDINGLVDRAVSRLEYSSINYSADASALTNFSFSSYPIILQTNQTYAILVKYDGDEDFVLWSARENDIIVGTNQRAAGAFAKNVVGYYELTEVLLPSAPNSSNSASVGYSTGSSSVWKSLKDMDLKFTVFCARFNVSTSGSNAAVNGYSVVYNNVKNHQEFITFDKLNSYAMYGGRYGKHGGLTSILHTIGWDDYSNKGELVYQVTPMLNGTLTVNSSSTTIRSNDTSKIDFTSVYKQNGTDAMYIVLISNNYMDTDTRNFLARPKIKYPTGSNQYDPFRSDTDVRKIVSIVNASAIIVDNNPTFSDSTARMSISPVGVLSLMDSRNHKLPEFDNDYDDTNPLKTKTQNIIHLDNSNANSAVRFVNNAIEYVALNLPQVSYNGIFSISNSSITTPMYGITVGAQASVNSIVAVGEKQTIQSSTDAVNWTTKFSNSSSNASLYSVVNGNSIYVAVGNNSLVLYSNASLSTWYKSVTPQTDGQYGLRGVAYGNGAFVAVGRYKSDKTGAYILVSNSTQISNGSGGWTQKTFTGSTSSGALRSVTYGAPGTFVAVGDNTFAISTDSGATWSPVSQNSTGKGQYFDVTYGNSTYVAVGSSGVQTSTDGVNWVYRSIDAAHVGQYIFSVSYGNGNFVAVGGRGSKRDHYVAVSPDGITWTYRDAPKTLKRYLDRQGSFRQIGYGVINSTFDVFAATSMPRDRRIGDRYNSGYGQFMYATSATVANMAPGANVESSTGTGYSSSDYIEISTANTQYPSYGNTLCYAYANIAVNGSGGITSTTISNTGFGLPGVNTLNNIKYRILNSGGTLSSGTGANLSFFVGSTVRTEHSGLVFSNTTVIDIPASKIVPSIRLTNSIHDKDYNLKMFLNWVRDGVTGRSTLTGSANGITLSQTSNTHLESNSVYLMMSRSNEVLGAGSNSSLVVNAVSNSDFSYPFPIFTDVYNETYIINNDYTNENTRHGNALAKHVSTKINFDQGKMAEDIIVYIDAYKPVGTDIQVFAKVYNSADFDAFDDKDWTRLTYTNAAMSSVYSGQGNYSDVKEYTFGFQPQPNTVFTSVGTVQTTLGNSTITGQGTTFSLDYKPGDLIKIQSPLFSNNYQISVVNSVTSDTSLVLTDGIANTNLQGSGFNIALLGRAPIIQSSGAIISSGYPYQAFNNITNGNVVRYYNSSMVPFDTYDTFQIKMVLLSNSVAVAPMVNNIRAIGISA